LNLIGISKFLKNAKNVADVSWAAFISKLEWKAQKNENNCQIIKVSRWYPSSKTCNKCGYIHSELKLSDRLWTCPSCGVEIERDFNAACNIRQEALKIVGQELPEYTSMESNKNLMKVLALSALGLNEVEMVDCKVS
jgi:putative transposase